MLLFALSLAHPGLEVPNFERCWGWCCCKLHLDSGACQALGPNADFALLCSDGLPLKPPVLRGPFSFSASVFLWFRLLCWDPVVTPIGCHTSFPAKGRQAKAVFLFHLHFFRRGQQSLGNSRRNLCCSCSVVGTSWAGDAEL